MEFMSPAQARRALELAGDVHSGRTDLPPEIKDINRQIQQALRKAEQFMLKLHVVDEGMVKEVVRLMLEKDRLYAEWVVNET